MRRLATAGSILLVCLMGFVPGAQARGRHHQHHHRHYHHHHHFQPHRYRHARHRVRTSVRYETRVARSAPQRSAMAELVMSAARRNGVPTQLALGVASVESGFNPRARSRSGAVGLMQILPGTARSLGCHGQLSNPSANAECGTRYLAAILGDHRGNVRVAAAMYNQGRFAPRVSRDGARYAALVMRHARRSPY